MRDYLAAIRGLTIRGRAFLASGGASIAAAAILGEQDLIAVGALLGALPLFSAFLVARTRYRLSCTRRLDPPRVTVGDQVRVRIRLQNVSRRPSSVLLVEDHAAGLAHRARFVLDAIEPGSTCDLSYSLPAIARGRFQVGPLTIRLTDPFGLSELERSFRSRDELVVAPSLERLPPTPPVGASDLSTEVRRTVARAGKDESTTRPYRSGDDLRKVHWKTTARVGELMVRRDERPLTGGATVLLDTGREAWAGTGDDGPFSWAVSAAGSIAVNLARSGYGVRLVTGTGTTATGPGNTVGALLDELAVVLPTETSGLHQALATLRSADHYGLTVVVLGRTDPATITMITAAPARSAPGIAVLVNLASWGLAAAGTELEAARQALTRKGWRVLVADRGTRLIDSWPRLFNGGGAVHVRRRSPDTGAGARPTAAPGRGRSDGKPRHPGGADLPSGYVPAGSTPAGSAPSGSTPPDSPRPRSAPHGPATGSPDQAPAPLPPTGPLYRPDPADQPRAGDRSGAGDRTGALYRPDSPYEPAATPASSATSATPATAGTSGSPASPVGRPW